ncbi:protein CMS1, partial [Lecanoromycetidae sp. Uapishka_2]
MSDCRNFVYIWTLILHVEKAYCDTSAWERPRTLYDLPDFIDRYKSSAGENHSLSSAFKQNGSPHTLVITSAGLRAADITRALRKFQTKEAVVAKLFAKHIKLKEAIAYVKRTRMSFGVGTPSRVIDLLDAVTQLERVLVDATHIDQKKRGILDMRETQEPLMQLLNRPELKSRYGSGSGSIQLILY